MTTVHPGPTHPGPTESAGPISSSDSAAGATTGPYEALVTALLDLRTDAATQRFDAELAHAVSIALVDPGVARTLRWWQRASTQAVADHLLATLPAALASIEASRGTARDDVRDSHRAWTGATLDLRDDSQRASRAQRTAADTAAPDRARPESSAVPTLFAPEQAVPNSPQDPSPTMGPPATTRSRLLVAGLTVLPPPTDDQTRPNRGTDR